MMVPRCLRWQVSLRCFFALLTAACLWLGFVVDRAHRCQRAEAALSAVEGASPIYDFELDEDGCHVNEPPSDSLDEHPPLWVRMALCLIDYEPVVGAELDQPPTEAVWQALESLPLMRALALNGNWVDDETLRRVNRFRELQLLNITSNNVTAAGMERLVGLWGLREVGLGCPQVADESLFWLGKLTRLKVLRFGERSLSPSLMAQLIPCQQLTRLNASGPGLSAEAAAMVTSFPKLQHIGLSESVPHEAYVQLRVAQRTLQDLSISIYSHDAQGARATSFPSVNEQKRTGIKLSEDFGE